MSPLRLAGPASVVVYCVAIHGADANYRATIEQWRAQHETELKADGGWLTVSGLFWLKEGINRAGSNHADEIVLPRGRADFGTFEHHQGKTSFRAGPGVAATVNGQPADGAMLLKSDAEENPDRIQSTRSPCMSSIAASGTRFD